MKNNCSRVECSTPVLQEFTNSAGVLHTGALTTIIDGLTSVCVNVADPQPRAMASIAMSVSVHNTASVGEVLRVVTTCDKVGKKIAFSSAEVFVGDRLVATGDHTLNIMPVPLIPEESS